MEEVLAKIRPHTSSSLPHQKTPATLLHALEDTFREQNTERTPTAYFAALLTSIDGTLAKNDTDLGDGDVLPAELYLLALVIPFVSPSVIRANLHTILSLTAPLFPALMAYAPGLRSQLTIYSTIFLSLDRSQLETQGIRQSFASVLHLCLDPRPKVRKKACGVVWDVLAAPPPPMARHPYADQVAEWIQSVLGDKVIGNAPRAKSSGKIKDMSSATDAALHILFFLRPVLCNLPPSALPFIAETLLVLPRLGNPYLSQSTYNVLAELVLAPAIGIQSAVSDQISGVIKSVLASPPLKSDTSFAPAWLNLLGNAMLAYHTTDPQACASESWTVLKAAWPFLGFSDALTRKAAVQSLSTLSLCFTPDILAQSISEARKGEASTTLNKLISQILAGLDSLALVQAIPDLLTLLSSLISNLRHRPSRASPSASESLLLPLIRKVGDLRIQKGFEHKEVADVVLATAMQVLGPEVLLRTLPLNLEPADRTAGQEPRAFLLPLLACIHPSPLSHFVFYFVPMSERMFNLQQAAEANGNQAEAKVWKVLIAQIWGGFFGYCSATVDLKEALDTTFSQLLSQLLYSQPDLRPSVLSGLKAMVNSNVARSKEGDQAENASKFDLISSEDAATNVAFLQTQAESWLAVLFNVFSSMESGDRGMVGEVIAAWASIAREQEIAKAYKNVVDLFRKNLVTLQTKAASNSTDGSGRLIAMTQDLLILLLPYLSPADISTLFQMCLSPDVLIWKDNAVQKRGYKILQRIVDSEKFVVEAESVLRKLDELGDGLMPAAKKDRFCLLCSIIPHLPSNSMHMIPSLIPEAVLGTKEPSEKARAVAFDLVVALGKKMSEGGIVKRDMIDGMDTDAGEAVANVGEYMTMVAGGLAGASPHMISATVTAISRLLFEFKDSIPLNMQTEIFTTMLVFLTSNNREIVKSVLGFIKLAIHTLPTELMRPHLKELVPALLSRSHDHKNHFKAKVRHIFERMLRRFSWDEVYACAGEDEAAKVLVNIRKRKERAKRKKASNEHAEGDEEDEHPNVGHAKVDAFEDVLYGSESELDDSDDEAAKQIKNPAKTKRKGSHSGARLRVDDDEPMDLLQGASSKITLTQPARRRKPGEEAARFKIDDDTGKMIIDAESDSDATPAKRQVNTSSDVAGGTYRESITAADGFTRGPHGRIKFNKDTKKRRRQNEDEDEDVEMADGEANARKAKEKGKVEKKFGHEFRAKKAGGDVKKGGVDPYAYMTLTEAAKRRGKGRIGIASK